MRLLRADEIEALIAGYTEGATLRELAARFGIHRHTVAKHLKDAGVQRRLQPLTASQIEEAARLYAEGMSVMEVGAKLGVHGSTVSLVLKRHGVARRNPWDHPHQRGLDAPAPPQ